MTDALPRSTCVFRSDFPSLLLLLLPLLLLVRLRPGGLCALASCAVLGPVGHLTLAAAKQSIQAGGWRLGQSLLLLAGALGVED